MDAAATWTALAEPRRRELLERLRGGPLTVGSLAAGLPISRPAVSQHLAVLEKAGLVRAHREGRRRIYAIHPAGIVALRAWLDALWDGVLESFREAAEASPPGDPR